MRRINVNVVILHALILMSQLAWVGTVNSGSEYSMKYSINYDANFENTTSYWSNSTWNPSPNPVDYWMKTENGIITLHYKSNRTDWGNTEVYQGKKPAFKIDHSLRFQDFRYKEGSGGLNLSAKVKRDIDPVWQGSPLSDKSPYPQANIGVYLWLEAEGWNYDEWSETSSLVIDIYFDSRHQDPTTKETITSKTGESYEPTTTPYDPQIHAGYYIGNLTLNMWQEFDLDLASYIDQTLQKCRDKPELPELPSNEVCIKFFGIYVDSFSAAVQASFDNVLLEDTNYEELRKNFTDLNNTVTELHSEIEDLKSQFQSLYKNYIDLMYAFAATTVAFLATTIYLIIRRTIKRS